MPLNAAALALCFSTAAAAAPVTLWAFGATTQEDATKVADAVAHVSGVTGCTVAEVTPAAARLAVTLAQGDGLALARALSESTTVPLAVERAEADLVAARWGPSQGGRVRYRVKPFEAKSPEAAAAARLASRTAELLLGNAPFLVVADKPENAQLTFAGKASLEGGTPSFEVRVLKDKAGEVAFARGKGDSGLEEALSQLVRTLPRRLSELESSKFDKNAALLALPAAMERARRASPLELVRFLPVLDTAVATLWMQASLKQPLTGLVLLARLDGFSAPEQRVGPLDLKPGAAQKVSIPAGVEPAKLQGTETQVAPLHVSATFKQGNLQRQQSWVVPVQIPGTKAAP